MKLFLCVLLPIVLIASEPPWKNADQPKRSQDFAGVNVIHRGNTPPMPTRVEGSRDLRKQAAKNSCKERISNLLNCCKGDE